MLVARVRKTLIDRAMLPPRARVLVALSGGPDSAALLLALATLAPELQITLRAATVDHGLRLEAAQEVEIAMSQAAKVGVPCTAVKLAVRPGDGVQARARQERYAALFEIARTEHCDRVAVGHTLDDQAETVLSRLLRGASIRGLRGIHPSRDDGVVRPLIDVPADEAHVAVAAAGWPIARDPSNDSRAFQRVRLRREVIPLMTAETPSAVRHLADVADDAAEVTELLDAMAEGVLRAATEGAGGIEDGVAVEPLRRAPAAVRRWALAIAAERAIGARPGRAQLLELERLLRGRGEVLLTGAARAEVGADGRVRFVPPPNDAPTDVDADRDKER